MLWNCGLLSGHPEEHYEVSQKFLDSIRSRGFEVNVQALNHDA
jgi:hypothetical protein